MPYKECVICGKSGTVDFGPFRNDDRIFCARCAAEHRLYEAAPELLKAAKAALRFVKYRGGWCEPGSEELEVELRAAIEKAEGGCDVIESRTGSESEATGPASGDDGRGGE